MGTESQLWPVDDARRMSCISACETFCSCGRLRRMNRDLYARADYCDECSHRANPRGVFAVASPSYPSAVFSPESEQAVDVWYRTRDTSEKHSAQDSRPPDYDARFDQAIRDVRGSTMTWVEVVSIIYHAGEPALEVLERLARNAKRRARYAELEIITGRAAAQ